MNRRTFRVLEMMMMVAIVALSLELGKILYKSRMVLWKAFQPSQVDAWRHLCDSTGAAAPIAPGANAVAP
jgi:hypothetical protein